MLTRHLPPTLCLRSLGVLAPMIIACAPIPRASASTEQVGCVLAPDSAARAWSVRWQPKLLIRRAEGTARELRGRVFALRDSAGVIGPLEGATVQLAGMSHGGISRADGSFVVLSMLSGVTRLEVRRIGYETWTGAVESTAGAGVYVEVALPPRPSGSPLGPDERVCPLIRD
jgi:hypothetical protein